MQKRGQFRISAFILALAVFLNCMGVFLVGFINVGWHRITEEDRSEVRTKVELHLNINALNSVVWIGDRDFIYDGKVYDVDVIKCANNEATIVCHCDLEESSVKSSLTDEMNDKKGNPSTSIKDVFSLLIGIQHEVELLPSTPLLTIEKIIFHHLNTSSSVVISLNNPPPELA